MYLSHLFNKSCINIFYTSYNVDISCSDSMWGAYTSAFIYTHMNKVYKRKGEQNNLSRPMKGIKEARLKKSCLLT